MTQHALAHKIEAAAEEEEEERKEMDLLEIAQRVSDNLDDFGVLLAEAAAVLQLQQQPTAEATDPAGGGSRSRWRTTLRRHAIDWWGSNRTPSPQV